MTNNNTTFTLGEKIKNTRLQKRVTLEEVSKHTKLTPSFLSQIERNIASPSVDSLRKIAQALNSRVSSFFEEEENKGLVFLYKKNKEAIPVDFKTHTLRLINNVFNINIHPFILYLSHDISGCKTEKELPSHNDEEFGMLLKGKILLSMDGDSHIMDEGDSVYLTSPNKHKITNIGTQSAEILLIYSTKF